MCAYSINRKENIMRINDIGNGFEVLHQKQTTRTQETKSNGMFKSHKTTITEVDGQTETTKVKDGAGTHEYQTQYEYNEDGSRKIKSVRIKENLLYGPPNGTDNEFIDIDGDGYADCELIRTKNGKPEMKPLKDGNYSKEALSMKRIYKEHTTPDVSEIRKTQSKPQMVIDEIESQPIKRQGTVSEQKYLSQKYDINVGRKEGADNICRTITKANGDKTLIYKWSTEDDGTDYTKCEIKKDNPSKGYTTVIDWDIPYETQNEALDETKSNNKPSCTVVINNATGKVVTKYLFGELDKEFPDK